MKIPGYILGLTGSAIIALQSWICLAIVDLEKTSSSTAAVLDLVVKKLAL